MKVFIRKQTALESAAAHSAGVVPAAYPSAGVVPAAYPWRAWCPPPSAPHALRLRRYAASDASVHAIPSGYS